MLIYLLPEIEDARLDVNHHLNISKAKRRRRGKENVREREERRGEKNKNKYKKDKKVSASLIISLCRFERETKQAENRYVVLYVVYIMNV